MSSGAGSEVRQWFQAGPCSCTLLNLGLIVDWSKGRTNIGAVLALLVGVLIFVVLPRQRPSK